MTDGFRLSRRALLLGWGSLAVGWWLPPRRSAAAPSMRTMPYRVDISMLWGVFRYSVTGSMVEEVDDEARRYRVAITGAGTGVTSHIEARGLIETSGRCRPLEMKNRHTMAGRESWLSINYDYGRGVADYRSVGHTLLLGRRREVDDLVQLPAGRAIDDAVSAGFNFASGHLEKNATGDYEMSVIRRLRPPGEGTDDVTPGAYRVEIVPFRFRVEPDAGTDRLVSRIDVSGWSTWASPEHPLRLVFAPDRRLESLEARLKLGSTVRMRFG